MGYHFNVANSELLVIIYLGYEDRNMTLNRQSIKWLPKVSFLVGMVLLAALIVFKATNASPEMEMLNSLERANSVQLFLKDIFF